jgi:hypothetical protein
VDDASNPMDIKQAALIQLKNSIKMRWNSKKIELDPEEKMTIRNTLLIALIRCSKSYKLIKLYK